MRALTLANLGIAEFWANEHEQALEDLLAAAGLALEYGNDFVLFIAESYLAAVDARPGRLADARGHARTAIHLGERRGWTDLPHMAIAYVALATVHLWWNELDEAERASELARDALGQTPEPMLPPVVAQLRAWIHALRGIRSPRWRYCVRRRVRPQAAAVAARHERDDRGGAVAEPRRAERARSWRRSARSTRTPPSRWHGWSSRSASRTSASRDRRLPRGHPRAGQPTSRTEAWAIVRPGTPFMTEPALRAIERALDLAELALHLEPDHSPRRARSGRCSAGASRRAPRIARSRAILAVLEQEPRGASVERRPAARAAERPRL